MLTCPLCKAEFKIDPEETQHARRLLMQAQELLRYLEALRDSFEKLDLMLGQTQPLCKRLKDLLTQNDN